MIACPGCGANLRFDITSQKMHCEYCGGFYDPYAFDSMEKDAEKQKVFDSYVYLCPQCGAELITTDQTDATSFCPYCGGASLLFDKISQENRPDYIIPFQGTKEDCKKAYLAAARKQPLTGSRYKNAKLVDSFRGIYMPFWSYKVDQKGDACLPAEGDSRREGDYQITKQYTVHADMETSYEGFAHDASKAFEDEISECLAPYDIQGRKPFTPAFLSGFYADVADVSDGTYSWGAEEACAEETRKRLQADERIRRAQTAEKISVRHFDGIEVPTVSAQSQRVFYPVWFMSYRSKDQITYATVNGQTGKVVADFPVSPLRFLTGALITAAIVFLLLNFVLTLKPGAALAVTSILLIIGMISASRRYKDLILKRAVDKDPNRMIRLEKFQKTAKKLTVISCIAAFLVIVINPVYNIVFYTLCLIEAGLLFLTIHKTFRCQLELAKRRPPQFEKKGGDDRA